MDDSLPSIVLASSSKYRRVLLGQLGLNFEWSAPEIDEARINGESPYALVERLAREKAAALKQRYPAHLLIASDQVAVLDGVILGKPGSYSGAVEQLQRCNGRSVDFLTSLCVLNTITLREQLSVDRYTVEFRNLTNAQINSYVARDNPIDCAGSFKVEGLGAALFVRQQGNDPSSLIGLPLIALCSALEQEGVDVLAAAP